MSGLKYGVYQVGSKYTFKYSVYATGKRTKLVSFWHDVPLSLSQDLWSFVAEIPKGSCAKMEVATDEPLTPIKQDLTRGGALRFYPSRIHWNYGMLPQTWEDPTHQWPGLPGLSGDGDPLDVIEIGRKRCKIGGVYKVKVLGAFALIDDGEVDWKILAIRCDDEAADLLNDVHDVDVLFPGELKRIHDWFRDYKVPDGKPRNAYGFQGKAQDAATAKHVIKQAHELYKNSRIQNVR
ncbi:Soluble inorganic pyrophosphatase 1, chloroplastic [Tetrabaena socialis]|uniref:inorganic diphosphatase n=1 Tax=Tetrabaena socialis TaxID=47790 RepID=A0A2J7ZJ32_9CHLO|nr:Soluble inorganic pyrophosphatase 1, chloroplastic [Tetrabaena socialis]|eukprot:PNH00282.1 Soluble inorganic pyrophosphatase 1, chloroplastic [Tetrabaena socialis]